MRVCASCGTRDPDDPYSREVILRDLPASHWLHVPRTAYERLISAESFRLVVPCESGGYSDVQCCRADLHNVYRDQSLHRSWCCSRSYVVVIASSRLSYHRPHSNNRRQAPLTRSHALLRRQLFRSTRQLSLYREDKWRRETSRLKFWSIVKYSGVPYRVQPAQHPQ